MKLTRIASVAAQTALALALAVGTAATVAPQPAQANQASPDYRPGTDLEPFCQWQWYAGRVDVFGPDADRYRVKLRRERHERHGRLVLTNTSGTFRTAALGFAEDDVIHVWCRVDGRWRTAEPA